MKAPPTESNLKNLPRIVTTQATTKQRVPVVNADSEHNLYSPNSIRSSMAICVAAATRPRFFTNLAVEIERKDRLAHDETHGGEASLGRLDTTCQRTCRSVRMMGSTRIE